MDTENANRFRTVKFNTIENQYKLLKDHPEEILPITWYGRVDYTRVEYTRLE